MCRSCATTGTSSSPTRSCSIAGTTGCASSAAAATANRATTTASARSSATTAVRRLQLARIQSRAAGHQPGGRRVPPRSRRRRRPSAWRPTTKSTNSGRLASRSSPPTSRRVLGTIALLTRADLEPEQDVGFFVADVYISSRRGSGSLDRLSQVPDYRTRLTFR